MRQLSAIAVILTISATPPGIVNTQADIDACTPDAMRLCMHVAPKAYQSHRNELGVARLWPVIERMSLEVVALVKGFCR